MSYLSPSFRAECEKRDPDLYAVLKLEAPDGTHLWSEDPVASDELGQAEARIRELGEVSESISLGSYSLPSLETTVELVDNDQLFAKLHATYRNSLRRSPAQIEIRSPNVPDGDELVAFVGRLKHYRMQQPGIWTLTLRVDDDALENSDVPRKKIVSADWPNAHSSALNEAAPVLWGYHDSAGITGEGMVGTLYVDTDGFRYLVSMGWMADVPTVYKDGEEVASGYAITHEVVNGTLWTLIDFTTDQGSASITCDVEGLTDAYDGTGELITNPVAQLAHFLTLFVFNDWRSGPYPTTDRIDTESFATVQAALDERCPGGSLWLGGEEARRAGTILEEWCVGFGVHPYWTLQGKLALMLVDWAPTGTYPDADSIVLQSELEGQISIPLDGGSVCREIQMSSLRIDAEGKLFRTLLVSDTSVEERVREPRQNPYSKAKA